MNNVISNLLENITKIQKIKTYSNSISNDKIVTIKNEKCHECYLDLALYSYFEFVSWHNCIYPDVIKYSDFETLNPQMVYHPGNDIQIYNYILNILKKIKKKITYTIGFNIEKGSQRQMKLFDILKIIQDTNAFDEINKLHIIKQLNKQILFDKNTSSEQLDKFIENEYNDQNNQKNIEYLLRIILPLDECELVININNKAQLVHISKKDYNDINKMNIYYKLCCMSLSDLGKNQMCGEFLKSGYFQPLLPFDFSHLKYDVVVLFSSETLFSFALIEEKATDSEIYIDTICAPNKDFCECNNNIYKGSGQTLLYYINNYAKLQKYDFITLGSVTDPKTFNWYLSNNFYPNAKTYTITFQNGEKNENVDFKKIISSFKMNKPIKNIDIVTLAFKLNNYSYNYSRYAQSIIETNAKIKKDLHITNSICSNDNNYYCDEFKKKYLADCMFNNRESSKDMQLKWQIFYGKLFSGDFEWDKLMENDGSQMMIECFKETVKNINLNASEKLAMDKNILEYNLPFDNFLVQMIKSVEFYELCEKYIKNIECIRKDNRVIDYHKLNNDQLIESFNKINKL